MKFLLQSFWSRLFTAASLAIVWVAIGVFVDGVSLEPEESLGLILITALLMIPLTLLSKTLSLPEGWKRLVLAIAGIAAVIGSVLALMSQDMSTQSAAVVIGSGAGGGLVGASAVMGIALLTAWIRAGFS